MKIKHLKRIISKSICALLMTITFVGLPFAAKAQTETYLGNQNEVMGTSDSRMAITIFETTDHVELHVTGVGEFYASGFAFSLLYNPSALVLTDETLLNDVPEGLDPVTIGTVGIVDSLFLEQFPKMSTLKGVSHQSLSSGMKCMNSEVTLASLNTLESMRTVAGQMLPVYKIFLRKVVPGAALQTSDIGFYNNPTIPRISSMWAYNSVSVRQGALGVSDAGYTKPELFVYRSPSFVVTDSITQITGGEAVLNGTFKKGTFAPSNTMLVAGVSTSANTGLLRNDDIESYGFIYSENDDSLFVNGITNKIIINDVEYDFPSAAQIAAAAGTMIFGSTTLYFNHFANSSSDQAKAFDVQLTGLTPNIEYYVWTYEQYTFETSDTYLALGNKMAFTTALCDTPESPEALLAQTFCGAPTIADILATVETGNTLTWYDAAVGGNAYASTDLLVDGQTYYGRSEIGVCSSIATEVEVTVLNSLSAPIATTPQTLCLSSLVSDLVAEGVGIVWYDAPTGGTLLNATDVLTDGFYYASQTTSDCESNVRSEVKVVINDVELNAPVITSPQYFCDYGTLEDVATDGNSVVWYSADGAALPSNTALSNATLYYAASSAGTCESEERTAVWVYTGMDGYIQTPEISTPQRFCEGATIQDINVPDNQIIWYVSETGSMEVPASTLLADNTTYYAARKAGECESTQRTPVKVLFDNPQGPEAVSPQVFCGTGFVLADLQTTGSGIVWYDSPVGGTLLPSTTAITSTPTLYFAAQSSANCETSRVGVLAYANELPNVPTTAGSLTVCANETTFDLTAAVTAELNIEYTYYSDQAITVIADPENTATPAGDVVYYVKATNASTGCENSTLGNINIAVINPPVVSVLPIAAYTSVKDSVTLVVTDDNASLNANAKTATISDENIARIELVNGNLKVVGIANGNTEIVYTSVNDNGCVTELVIPVQIEGLPSGVLTGKDIVKCNVLGGGDTTTVQIAYVMGGVAPWTITVSDESGAFTKDTTIVSIEDFPVNIIMEIPENLTNVPEFTTYAITNVVDGLGSSKQTHYGAVRIGVNPSPVINIIANSTQEVCSGEMTMPISFEGVATTYSWNVDKNIGLENHSSNVIPSFVAVNETASPVIATISIVPQYWYNNVVCLGDTLEAKITVNPAPKANFVTTVDSIGKIIFTDKSSTGVTAWTWNFGDGTTSSAQNPTHVYTASGIYEVTLTVELANACEATITKEVKVNTATNLLANFVVNNQVQCATGNEFWFTDMSTIYTEGHSVNTWAWDFGDGTSLSTDKNPSHTYASAGIYTVTLVVTETPGQSVDSVKYTVSVTDVPVITDAAAPAAICEGEKLQVALPTISWKGNTPVAGQWLLDGKLFDPTTTALTSSSNGKTLAYQVETVCGVVTSTGVAVVVNSAPVADFSTEVADLGIIKFTDKSTNANTYAWNLGDGSTSTLQSPEHTYTQSGSYDVTLTVTSVGGCTSTVTKRINVSTTTDLVAKFDLLSLDTQCKSGNSFVFNSTSTISTPNHSISTYSWNFGDGSAVVTTQNATYAYAAAGTYTVTLTVTETPGNTTSSVSKVVRVIDVPAITDAAAPAAVCEGGRLQVALPTINWNGNTPVAGQWLLGGFIINPATTTLTSLDNGKTLAYQVETACGSVTSTGVTVVVNSAPIADFSTEVSDLGTIKFTDKSTNADTYAWNLGDGSTISTLQSPEHTYTQSGSYDVTLTVTSTSGCTSTTTRRVDVSTTTDLAARFDLLSLDAQCKSGNSFVFNSTSTISTPSHSISAYSWNFGDGSAAVTTQNATYAYTAAGTYTVTLTVTETPGNTTSSVSKVVRVIDVPVITDAAAPTAICDGGVLQVALPTINWNGNTPVAGQWLLGGNIFNPVTATLTTVDNGKTLAYQVETECGVVTSTGVAVVVNNVPVADFVTAIVDLGTIEFTDASTNADSYAWNFGDGSTSTLQNPEHTYTQSGSYDVTLTVTSTGGCTSAVTRKVDVSTTTDLAARFEILSLEAQCKSGNSFAFNSISTISTPSHSISAYSWDFGDGSAAVTTRNATYSYAAAGTYTVTLTVTETPGNTTSSISRVVRVMDVPTITDGTAPEAVCEGGKLQVALPTINWNGNTPATGQWLLGGFIFDPMTTSLTANDNGKILSYRVETSCGSVVSTGNAVTVLATPEMALENSMVEFCGNVTSVEFPYTLSANMAGIDVYYSIAFGEEARKYGFQNVAYELLTGNTIEIQIPSGLTHGYYGGSISIKTDGGCQNTSSYNFFIHKAEETRIVTQPTSKAICGIDGFTLSVEAVGANLTYQWYLNNTPVSGATSAVYMVSAGDMSDFGDYYVEINGACGNAVSNVVTVEESTIAIYQRWGDENGGTLHINNKENYFVDYQWYMNDKPIGKDATSPYFVISDTDGAYRVQVTYSDGTKEMSCPYKWQVPTKSKTEKYVKIFPNPVLANNEFSILVEGYISQGKSNEITEVRVYSLQGRELKRVKNLDNGQGIKLSLPSGVYVLSIEINSNETVERTIVVK